jgi:diguanylate cyclase (GGDEF)-like protein/PAS domain S-box-containing protein
MSASYNVWLVALSIAIAMFASFTTLSLTDRIMSSSGKPTKYWLAGGAISMGSGIWSMHFIGMLAFHLPIPIAYDIQLTLASVIPAVIASGIALITVSSSKGNRLLSIIVAGVFMGAGISLMHYTGMAAMQMFPAIRYDPLLFIFSIGIAIGASITALAIAFYLKKKEASKFLLLKKLLSALIMGIAIAGMHYTGMFAANFSYGSICLATPQGIQSEWLAILVSIGSLAIMMMTLIVAIFDARLSDQNAQMVEKLTHVNEQLNVRAQHMAEIMTADLRATVERDGLFKAVVEQSSDAIVTRDAIGNITSWNKAASTLFGYDASEVIGKSLGFILGPVERTTFAIEDKPLFQEITVKDRLKQLITISLNVAPLLNQNKVLIGDISIIRDISQHKETQEQLLQAAAVFKSTTEGVLITDNQTNIIAVNQAFTRLSGYSEEESVGKKAGFTRSGQHSKEFYKNMWHSIEADDYWRGEVIDRRKNGETYPKWLSISVVRNDDNQIIYYVGVFSDITHIKEAEEQLQYIANHDFLTDLPNRLLFEDRLEHAIARAKKDNTNLSLLFLDLDRFKNINDSLGHLTGDRLLQEVVHRIKKVVEEADTLARVGGDELIIIREENTDKQSLSLIAEKIINAVSQPIHIDQHELFITTSIGISTFPEDGNEGSQLLKNADAAMYQSKNNGRNRYSFYSSNLSSELIYRLNLESELRRALDNREFMLYYQPLVSSFSQRIIGAEALIRWKHPKNGLLFPDEFLPIAEESGLLFPIEEWVIATVCQQVKILKDSGHTSAIIALNLSSNLISYYNVADMIALQLKNLNIDGNMLQLEITETSIVAQTEKLVRNLEMLKGMGVSIAIDDFGTGYSSMSYLKRFDVNKLKIDRSFIRDIVNDPNDKAIVKAVLAMAHSLGITVTAEGVETEEQYLTLADEGCDEVQGYYFSEPISGHALVKLLQQGYCHDTNISSLGKRPK